MNIVRATAAHVPALRALAELSPSAPRWPASAYQAIVDDRARIALVALEGDVVRGFVVAGCASPDWEIENIVVHPATRRQGIARDLMCNVFATARQGGAARLLLEVRESNQGAVALYSALDFAVTGRRRAYYRHPVEDALLLELKLRAP